MQNSINNHMIMTGKRRLFLASLILSGTIFTSQGADQEKKDAPDKAAPPTLQIKPGLDRSLLNEANAAISRGVDWLISQQKADGSWSNTNFPALTGLSLWAVIMSNHPGKEKAIAKALPYLLSCVQDDGGIYREIAGQKGGGLGNYNTSICMIALHAAGDPKLSGIIQNARKYLKKSQHLDDDIYYGGFGYDAINDRAYADLNNSIFAFEAMRLTESIETIRKKKEPKTDINWEAAVKFVSRCQNGRGAGPDNDGGFFYRPDESKAGVITNENGAVIFKSHGSMTYAGLLSLRYGKIGLDDQRVNDAINWANRHWTVEVNPPVGSEGVYSYYHLVARTIVVYKGNHISLGDNISINGRSELAGKLVGLQKIEPRTGGGFWVNETNRFWESDPVLATAYALLSLEIITSR